MVCKACDSCEIIKSGLTRRLLHPILVTVNVFLDLRGFITAEIGLISKPDDDKLTVSQMLFCEMDCLKKQAKRINKNIADFFILILKFYWFLNIIYLDNI